MKCLLCGERGVQWTEQKIKPWILTWVDLIFALTFPLLSSFYPFTLRRSGWGQYYDIHVYLSALFFIHKIKLKSYLFIMHPFGTGSITGTLFFLDLSYSVLQNLIHTTFKNCQNVPGSFLLCSSNEGHPSPWGSWYTQ